mmetsp:Transcript_17324/g.35458  ORF Transcript_17324/g.35458 Transcript_17324/m.35458 type:complete len:362 (+) Transcript_17324:145-1230(+)
MALMSRVRNISWLGYSGRSSWLKHVCEHGSRDASPHLWMLNFWGPFIPRSALKPSIGTWEVPVTNWRSRARSSWLSDSTTCQYHWICTDSRVYPVYSVLARRSSTSMDGSPHMSSSSSEHVKMQMRSGGMSWWKPSLNASICARMPLVSCCSATSCTYSCLFSSVTATLRPLGFRSIVSISPNCSRTMLNVSSRMPVMSLSSIQPRLRKYSGSIASTSLYSMGWLSMCLYMERVKCASKSCSSHSAFPTIWPANLKYLRWSGWMVEAGFGWYVRPLAEWMKRALSGFSICFESVRYHSRVSPPASTPSSPLKTTVRRPLSSSGLRRTIWWKESSKTTSRRTLTRMAPCRSCALRRLSSERK